VKLHIIGDGTLRASLEQRVRGLGVGDGVRFWGAVGRDRVADAMAAADVLCITSITEAGPTVGFEALASGLPIAMTAVGEVALVLAANPGAGEVVEAREEAVAAGIARVLDRPLDVRRTGAAMAAGPFGAAAVLAPVYEDHRQLVHGSATS
jgi:glycosyltransferase involved in cell wall biosynthesis